MSARIIYGLYSTLEPEVGVRYVGFSTKGVSRLREHRYTSLTGDSPVYRWMRRVGAETVVLEVLEDLGEAATVGDLLAAETKHIKEQRERSDRLLNVQYFHRRRQVA